MFQSKSVRVFSAILLGSVAGVGWGAYYHASHTAALFQGAELDKMLNLLACIMFGSFGGLLAGIVIGVSRLRWPVVLACLIGVAGTFFLPPGMGLFAPGKIEMTFLMSQAVVLAVAIAVSVAVGRAGKRPAIEDSSGEVGKG